MKKYCIKILLFCGVTTLITIMLLCCRYYVCSNVSWKIPQAKHILVLGASHIERGFDDGLSKEAYNYDLSSERYMFTYLKLNKMLQDNPQIDTIILQCAPTDLWEHTDDKYFVENEQLMFVPLYLMLLNKEELNIYKDEPLRTFSIFFKSLANPKYYIEGEYRKLLGGYIGESLNNKTLDTTTVKPEPIVGEYGHLVNYKYLHKIVKLCKVKGIKLYFIYCPVYHPEYFYDQDFYYKALKNEFSDVELLDYSNFPILYDEMYDAHHLNHKGAQHLTRELMHRLNFQ